MIVVGMVKLVKFIFKYDIFKRLVVFERNNYILYIIKVIFVLNVMIFFLYC